MKYRSTRDHNLDCPADRSFEDVVMAGLADDGGLFVPVEIPRLPVDFVEKWKDSTFQDLCLHLFPMYTGNCVPSADLKDLVSRSFATPSIFRDPLVAPVVEIGDDGFMLLELFHGPTFAFKDVALQFLGNLFQFFLARSSTSGSPSKRMIVLGATSGDTGGAAIESLRSKPGIDAFILHPLGRVSPIQRAQMTSILDDNIFNVAVKGTFDDCQKIVKDTFADSEWRSSHPEFQLGAVNSINWARILAQVVYYFHAYFQMGRRFGFKDLRIRFSVPTGNFGDVLAGFYARRMGLPIDTLLIATNENDILHRFFSGGVYARSPEVNQTISPAMDIQVSSNFERWLFHFMVDSISAGSGVSSAKAQKLAAECISNWMESLKRIGKFSIVDTLPVSLPASSRTLLQLAQLHFQSCRVTDSQIMETIGLYSKSKSNSVVLDPHTAIGVYSARAVPVDKGVKTICLATAHPIKFVGAVVAALNGSTVYDHLKDADYQIETDVLNGKVEVPGMVLPEPFRGLMGKKTRCFELDNSKEVVQQFILSHSARA
eukprot:Partr_v1_DN26886_c1_g1_i1_m40245 putative threonine